MRINDQDWSIIDVIRAFYPFQLVKFHVKHNLFSFFFWIVLFMIIYDSLGYSFGIPFLFLSPEYLGEVSSISFMLLGFSIGGFIMGFNTYSYMKLGPHFPFLTTIAKPFLKFCVNNSLIPLIFVTCHSIQIFIFQRFEEFNSVGTILFYILSYFGGILIFMLFSFFYFFPLSKRSKSYQEHSSKPITSVIHKREKWYTIFRKEKDRTYIYIGKRLRLMPSRSSKHFDRELVEKIFAKNRINASLYEILTVFIFFGLGFFSNYDLLEVPAAFSIVLLLTISQMIFSALQSWLRGWVYPVMILVLLMMDSLSVRTQLFNYTSYAYGLSYENDIIYSSNSIHSMALDSIQRVNSKNHYLSILNKWKTSTGEEKPKLIILNTSGGGSRSALWTFHVLQHIDKRAKGAVSDHMQFISGASGGMIGAAYYRELLLEQLQGVDIDRYSPIFKEKISSDMLNKLSFMASTNDIFIRYQKCYVNGHKYTKDRGYAFEQQLHKNTENRLNHELGYYTEYENNADIPVILFSPTIVNDGRRLLMSSQSFHFLTNPDSSSTNENIDYQYMFRDQSPNDIRFSSALRASATFPFVMPMITMPTRPEIQLMDAGIRDNYGGKATIAMLEEFEEWIKENTSGVIILQIRDTKKVLEDESYSQVSFMDKITLPFGNMYKNFPRVQDFNQDQLIDISQKAFDFNVDIVSFNLLEKKNERISLSWHLTSQEKKKIENAIYSDNNQNSIFRLKQLLK